jgi:predicted nucleotidyltransferase
MNANSLLKEIAVALDRTGLEVVMIGNAAAALQGSPVTTVDIDFMFRKTDANITKLKKFARLLNATILRPFYPVSQLYRVVNDDRGIQVDFMAQIDGISSFASLRSRADIIKLGSNSLKISSLDDIITSKRAAGRDRDKAVLKILEKTLREKKNLSEKKKLKK